MSKAKEEIKPRLLKRMMAKNKNESETESYVEYEGMQFRDISEIKDKIDFSISKLKDQYESY